MIWTCERGEGCREMTLDPFSGENLGPQEPALLWPDDTCGCGVALADDGLIIRVCEDCDAAQSAAREKYSVWYGDED